MTTPTLIEIFATSGRLLTAPLRALPGALIIGAQRAGTTSLYRWLVEQPRVREGVGKEVHFFDHSYGRGSLWYRSRFPFRVQLQRANAVALDATPSLLYLHDAPARVADTLPDVRLIALLRDPVERAYSHFALHRQRGLLPETFEEALELENSEPGGPRNQAATSVVDGIRANVRYTYVRRGQYAEQLARWRQYFDGEQLLVLQSEMLQREPHVGLRRVHEHLGLDPDPHADRYGRHNATALPPMSAETRSRLREHFAPWNARLFDMLGETWDWP